MKKVFLIALAMCTAQMSLAAGPVTNIGPSSDGGSAVTTTTDTTSPQKKIAPPLGLCVDVASTEDPSYYTSELNAQNANAIPAADITELAGNWKGCPQYLTWARGLKANQAAKLAKVDNHLTIIYSDTSNPNQHVCAFSSGIVTMVCAIKQ